MNVMEELRKRRRAFQREVLGRPIPDRIGKRARTQIAKLKAKIAKGWNYTYDDLVRDFLKQMERQINAAQATRAVQGQRRHPPR